MGGQGGSNAAADFTLTSVSGAQVSLSEHLGKKVILLDFWATWCVPCAAEMPHLQALYEKYGAQGLIVLGIAMDGPESVASVAPFVRRNQLTFPILLDEDSRIASIYNSRKSAPLSVLIDKNGRIAAVREGYNPGDEAFLEKDVDKVLDKPLDPPPAAK